ncbi:hypothetical protein NL676_017210 [Syzygium grande]|nr:hypothetical protein NL676_017210 [Syzygium grande]
MAEAPLRRSSFRFVPVKCFRVDPVCSVDRVTYWCGCADAACSSMEVAKLGYCPVGNGSSGLLPNQALLFRT